MGGGLARDELGFLAVLTYWKMVADPPALSTPALTDSATCQMTIRLIDDDDDDKNVRLAMWPQVV